MWQNDEQEEATKHRAGEKEENIGRFKLFLHRGINSVHKFLCTCNTVCMHITCTVVTVHGIFEGLFSYWFVVIFLMLGKIPSISYYSVFDCFIFFFSLKWFLISLENCRVFLLVFSFQSKKIISLIYVIFCF